MADDADGQPVDPAEVLENMIEVSERLRRVLAVAVAGIDDRHGRDGSSTSACARFRMTQNQQVRHLRREAHDVFQGLLIEADGPGRRRIGEADDMAADP